MTWETKRGDSKVEAKNGGMIYVCGDRDVDRSIYLYIYIIYYINVNVIRY